MKLKDQITIAERNLKLVMLESALTAALLSMSIMTPFFYSIGLSQLQISQAQVIFTVVTMFLNLPTGWIADRFSRKWANVIGDFGVALTFMVYALAQNFLMVVVCECFLGFFMALSQGVDQSLLRHFCQKIDPSEDFFRQKNCPAELLALCCNAGLSLAGRPNWRHKPAFGNCSLGCHAYYWRHR